LGIRFHDFFCLFFIMLSWSHDSRIVLNGLTSIDLIHFLCSFLIKIFTNYIVQYCVWQSRLRIELHNLFKFAFYSVILVSLLKLRIWCVKSGCFLFFYMRLSPSYELIHEFGRLTRVIFMIFIFIFLNSFFNIGLIENWTL
jgi:hypothetical protein